MRRFLVLLIFLALGWSDPASAAPDEPQTHTVAPGQTLGAISKRYHVTIDALCNANGITRRAPIKPGQKLVVPARSDKDGSQARQATEQSAKRTTTSTRASKKPQPSRPRWQEYAKPARRRGFVTLEGQGRHWSGYAIVKGNRVPIPARRAFRRILYSWRTGDEHDIDERLIRLLTKVSDQFGGRPLKIVSGYREHSHAQDSKHKSGRACDFSIEGVPNEALLDYLLTFDGVGVGYYPNSSFVHLDVRSNNASWTDLSGPGEPPRYLGAGPPADD